jgi:AraC-like DNA-binding protein
MPINQTKQESWIKEFSNRRYQTLLVGANFVPHQREFHIVAMILRGAIFVKYRERNYALSEGDSIFIPAGEIHAFHTSENQTALVNFHYIDTVEAYLVSQGEMCPEIDTLLRTKLTSQNWAPELLSDLEQPLDNNHYKQWLGSFLIALNDHIGKREALEELDFDSFVKAKTYIQNNLEEPFCLDDISERFNINRWQLSRKFKPLFGVTLFQHIHASKMVKAKELLSQNNSIIGVAHDLGYSDQSHFTRFFKRFVGISPNKWVKLVSMSKVS